MPKKWSTAIRNVITTDQMEYFFIKFYHADSECENNHQNEPHTHLSSQKDAKLNTHKNEHIHTETHTQHVKRVHELEEELMAIDSGCLVGTCRRCLEFGSYATRSVDAFQGKIRVVKMALGVRMGNSIDAEARTLIVLRSSSTGWRLRRRLCDGAGSRDGGPNQAGGSREAWLHHSVRCMLK